MSKEDTPLFDTNVTHTGRVKWFNNRSGYGFATVTGGERDEEDVFVHHSGIKVGVEQYKYLVQGEYIQFNLRSSDNENHPFQADNIRGINNGKLMCETHLEIKKQRDSRELTDDRVRDNGPSQNVRKNARERIRAHGGGPREGDQWFLVKRGSRGREKGKVYKEANQVTTNEGVINN